MTAPQATYLSDQKRMHLHHGPIDLIIEAFGPPPEIKQSYRQAQKAFQSVLSDLAAELPQLRSPNPKDYQSTTGPVARRMTRAVHPHYKTYVTPMAAVAGSVADHILSAMTQDRALTRAYVNNGGDCALFLTPNTSLKLAAIAHGDHGTLEISHKDPVRGVATSGWRGRSHSLGIADAVTIVAKDAASADVAATLIANATDLPGHPSITRQPANQINPDSDLKNQLVTTHVGSLTPNDTKRALSLGLQKANEMKQRGLIQDALLFLNGQTEQTAHQRTLLNA